MKKYIKKQSPILAERWFGFESEGFVHIDIKRHKKFQDDNALCEHCGIVMRKHGWIETRESGYIVCPGDWIIKGNKGEFYPVKSSVFKSLYDEVES